jgi:hypothetical protein
VKKLQIDLPWSQLWTSPVEVTIEDLHLIIKASEGYDREYVKRSLIALKQKKVQHLLD